MKTIQELEKLPDDELRVMLAEACGEQTRFFRFSYPGHAAFNGGENNWRIRFKSKSEADDARTAKLDWWPEKVTPVEEYTDAGLLPNYPADLNACYQVEISLKDDCPYIHALIQVCGSDKLNCYYASARQRAIALIATLQA